MDKRGTVPWSQQVDEELYGNPSLFRENKTAELKNIHLHQSFERINLMKSDENYSEDKINQSNVSSYNTKNYSTNKMSSDETQKTRDKNFPMPNQSNMNKKKITWASVASQPAKPNRRNNIGLKKKGPGMPPPPMIPGKNSLNVSPWDLAKNTISTESSGSIPKFIPSSSSLNDSASPIVEDNINFAATKPNPNPNPNPKLLISEQQYSDLNRRQNNPNPNPNNTNNYRKQQQHQQQQHPIKNTKSFASSVVEAAPSEGSLIQKHHHHEEQNQSLQHSNVSSNYKESFQNEPSTRSLQHQGPGTGTDNSECTEIVLKQLQDRNNYNPIEMDLQKAALSRFFVIKSYSEDDIHRSIKYEIWCSTDHGNKKLDEAFKERMKEGGNVMLYFSVNGSGHFCGMALMMTPVDYKSTASVWSQDKWKGKFKVKWIYVKDVPNSQLRHIRLENNENKSVTNSRDTQEIPLNQGIQMLKILHSYKHLTSIFDDFYHYEKKQEESVCKKPAAQFGNNYAHPLSSSNAGHGDIMEPSNNWQHTGHFEDRDRERERERERDRDRTMFNHRRDGGGEHSNSNMHRSNNNRRYGKPLEHQQQQQRKQNNDELDKPTSYVSQNNEASKHNIFEQQHSNPSMENSGSRCS